jgi:hypothetical protein
MEILFLKTSLTILFALAVTGKVTGKTKSTFEKAGYSHEVIYAVAIAEIVLVIALFTRYELLATLCLLAIIAGAFFTLGRLGVKPVKYTMVIIASILLTALLYFLIR